MSTATSKHRQAFTLALRNISPSFAALHASRLRLRPESDDHRAGVQTPPLTTLTCLRCGYISVHVRIVKLRVEKQKRQKHRQNQSHAISQDIPARVIQRTCATCAFVERIPVSRGAAVVFGKTPRRTKAVALAVVDGSTSSDTNAVVIQDAPAPSTRSHSSTPWQSPPSPQPQHSKKTSRSKRKQGLHDLLARNRERQRQDRDRKVDSDAVSSGLASFLSGL